MRLIFLKTGIDLYSKAVKQCISLFDGKILSDSDLLDDASNEKSTGKKKSSKQHNSEERMKTLNVQILIPEAGYLGHIR